jgi:thiosulfate reductase cytochrome b subunit
MARASRGPNAQVHNFFPFFLVALVLLYVVYAILEQHQKIRSALNPSAIGVNLRNIVIMLLTVILGINVLKIAAAKAVAWFGDIPALGTGARFFARLMGGV